MEKLYPKKLFAIAFLLICASFHQVSGQITTVAGRHTYLGNGGAATNAGLFNAYAIARDTVGNLYIATTTDNQVRRVDAVTGTITTVAGTGVAGFSGDNGPATAAQLNFTTAGLPGLAVDKHGNVYIGDFNNNRIRKINVSTSTITTIAGNNTNGGYSGDGGLATQASLSGPAGIAIDTAGNIYFSDYGNDVIRRIDAVTQKISTVAGNYNFSITGGYSGDGGAATAAALGFPERIAVDASDNIFIADEGNYVVREVTASTQKISTIAGNNTPGFSGDGGAAISAEINNVIGIALDASGNIYLADQGNNRIREINASTQKISTIAGNGVKIYAGDGVAATSAPIGAPSDVLVDKAGNVYIDDYFNNRIREVNASTKDISTIAGDGTNGFQITIGGTTAALQAQLNPYGVTYSADGDMLIADGYYYDVRDINTAGSAYSAAGLASPDPASASKGAPVSGVTAPDALFNAPLGVVTDANNNIYVADVFNNVVRVINHNADAVSTYAGTGTAGYSGDNVAASSSKLNAPYGIAIDKKGNLYIADAGNNRIREVNASTLKITTIAGNGTAGSTGDNGAATSAELSFPNGVAVDTAGNVFVLDKGNKSVRKITASTGVITTILSDGDVFSGIATDGAGNIFVSDSTNNTIVRINRTNFTYQAVAGNGTAGYSGDNGPAVSAALNNPRGLYINSQGYIYVADLGNNVIRKIIMGALPVTLESFTAQKVKNTVLLDWSTSTEVKNDYFDIERKGDNGGDWEVIGSLPGHGNSNVLQTYTFTDASPLTGNNYYRLKQVDGDGNFAYSYIRTVNVALAWSVLAYPNPVKNSLSLDFNNSTNENATIVVYNAAGSVVLVKQQPVTQGPNHIVLSEVQHLAQGIYFVKLSTQSNNYQLKFVRLGE